MKNVRLRVVYLCSLLVFIGLSGSFTIDMYVPSLPSIANHFLASANSTQQTISIYLIACVVGQFIYGPLT